MGAVNGHGNARSIVRVQSVVANGGEVCGVRLLSRGTVDRIFEPQVSGVDLVLGMPLTMGLGYGLPHPAFAPFIPQGQICFWGGWGGSLVLVDAGRRMTLSYVMNKMGPGAVGGPNAAELTALAYQSLDR